MAAVPNRVKKQPDGTFLIPRWDDRENVLYGMDFGTRMDVLEGVRLAAHSRLARPGRQSEARAYAVYVALEGLHEIMMRQRITWEKLLGLVHPDVLTPEFRDLDISRVVAHVRRTTERRLIIEGRFVVNRDIHERVLRMLARGTHRWTDETLAVAVKRVEQCLPVVLKNGCRYDHKAVAYTLDYYGVGARHRYGDQRGYRVNLRRLAILLHILSEEHTLDMTRIGWMHGRYRFGDGMMMV